MSDENPVGRKDKVHVEDLSAYGAGVADGGECRRRGGTIPTLRLVAINDEYSAGFRAGYFQRG